MKNKLKLSLLLILGFGVSISLAQESTNASGGDASGGGGTVAYSIGQAVYTYKSGTNGNVNQGVQQAYDISLVGIDEKELGIDLSIFPNPTSDVLHLQFEEFRNYGAVIQLVDRRGKVLYDSKIMNASTSLDFSNYSAGIYILNVISEYKNIKTFKIVKN